MLVTVDISQYKAAVKFIMENNKYLTHKEEADIREMLNKLIRDAVKYECTMGTAGILIVPCEENTVDIYVNPDVSEGAFYMEINV